MRRILTILFLLTAVRLFAAAGDVQSVYIRPEGWSSGVAFSGLNTNGTYDFKLALTTNIITVTGQSFTNVVTLPSASTPKLTVTSSSFTDLGAATTITRTLYLDKQVRKAYPNNAANDEILSNEGAFASGNVTNRMAISDYLYSGDTATIDIPAGLYTAGGTPNNAITGLAVNNGSVIPYAYAKAFGMWSCVPFQCIQSNTMTLSLVAFHREGQQGRPIKVARVVARDQHSHAATNFVTNPSRTYEPIPSALLALFGFDPLYVTEYVTSIDISTFTALDLIRCDFALYPWVGDSTSVLDTMDGVNVGQQSNYGPITNLCDRSLTYGASYAIVSTTNNFGTDGVVVQSTNAGWPAKAFDTWAHAYSAVVASNNIWYGRNDAGAAHIYTRAGNPNVSDWMGSGTPSGNIPATWVTYAPMPGELRTNCWVSGQSGNNIAKGRDRFYNLWLSNSAAIFVYSATATHASWFDENDIYLTSLNAMDTHNYYATGNRIYKLTQGFRVPAGDDSSPTLVRGNLLYDIGIIQCYTVIGNYRPNSRGGAQAANFAVDSATGMSGKSPQHPIFAFNLVMSHWNNIILSWNNLSNWFGSAIVGNVMEQTTNTVGSYIASVFETDNKSGTNLVSWNNTWAGQRWNYCYNSAGTANPHTMLFSFKNNLADSVACKTDIFPTANEARTNNWPVVFGSGMSGNFISGISNVGTVSFWFEFTGLNSFQNVSTRIPSNYVQFVSASCFNGISPAAGDGNYRVQSQSPSILNPVRDWVLPYDIEGVSRGLFDPPGAYATASPRKGAGFFAQ